jgi:hypothetical protein
MAGGGGILLLLALLSALLPGGEPVVPGIRGDGKNGVCTAPGGRDASLARLARMAAAAKGGGRTVSLLRMRGGFVRGGGGSSSSSSNNNVGVESSSRPADVASMSVGDLKKLLKDNGEIVRIPVFSFSSSLPSSLLLFHSSPLL